MNWLKNFSFEAMYLAIAIATFNHTMWFSAYAFEGLPPTDEKEYLMWAFKGSLIAFAVDVGMFLTSRSIISSKTRANRAILVISFLIAAVTSFFMQLGYMAINTPEIVISSGVNEYWLVNVVKPLIDASVIILPLSLPLLASFYTLARVSQKTEEIAETRNEKLDIFVSNVKKVDNNFPLLDDGEKLIEVLGIQPHEIDFEKVRMLKNGSWVNYQSKARMLSVLRQMAKKKLQEA